MLHLYTCTQLSHTFSLTYLTTRSERNQIPRFEPKAILTHNSNDLATAPPKAISVFNTTTCHDTENTDRLVVVTNAARVVKPTRLSHRIYERHTESAGSRTLDVGAVLCLSSVNQLEENPSPFSFGATHFVLVCCSYLLFTVCLFVCLFSLTV